MQAIETKYLPATNTRGSRIKATSASGKSITRPYPHELPEGENAHWHVAHELAKSFGWHGNWSGGSTRDGYTFVRESGVTWKVTA